MREWLLRPSLSIDVINARHEAVAFFVRPENLTVAGAMHSHLQGIRNVPRVVQLLKSGKAKPLDWQGLVKVRSRDKAVYSFYNRLSVRISCCALAR